MTGIVDASDAPLSILIVGVGDAGILCVASEAMPSQHTSLPVTPICFADFSDMDTLDGDDKRLSSQGKIASRDIVQVPFSCLGYSTFCFHAVVYYSMCLPGMTFNYFFHVVSFF